MLAGRGRPENLRAREMRGRAGIWRRQKDRPVCSNRFKNAWWPQSRSPIGFYAEWKSAALQFIAQKPHSCRTGIVRSLYCDCSKSPGEEGKSSSESWIRDIDIHGNVNHWYLPIDGKRATYRLQIGYRTPSDKFYVLIKSNVVTTPRPGAPDSVNGTWRDLEQHDEDVLPLEQASVGERIHVLKRGRSSAKFEVSKNVLVRQGRDGQRRRRFSASKIAEFSITMRN